MNLANFIRKNKNLIADEWIDFATENIIPTENMEREEVKDHVQEILERIIDDMNSSQTNEEQKIKSRGWIFRIKLCQAFRSVSARYFGLNCATF